MATARNAKTPKSPGTPGELLAAAAGARGAADLAALLAGLRARPSSWRRCLAGLPRGAGARAALRRLFLAAGAGPNPNPNPIEEGEAILGARFDLRIGGGARPFTWPQLLRLWEVLEELPESAVADNPALRRLCRAAGDGLGVYHGSGTRSPLGPHSIEVGVERLGARSLAYGVPLDRFRAAVHHEIGHAVADRLRLYDTLYAPVPHSPWRFQGPLEAFLRQLFPGGDPQLLRLGELYLCQPPGPRRSLRRALSDLQAEARRARRPQPSRSLLSLEAVRQLCHNSRHALPCYHPLVPLPDGLVYTYDSYYQRGFVLDHGRLQRTRVSAYQARSPNEWFAELHAVYYGGRRPGALLRRRGRPLAEVAGWLDEHLGR